MKYIDEVHGWSASLKYIIAKVYEVQDGQKLLTLEASIHSNIKADKADKSCPYLLKKMQESPSIRKTWLHPLPLCVSFSRKKRVTFGDLERNTQCNERLLLGLYGVLDSKILRW